MSLERRKRCLTRSNYLASRSTFILRSTVTSLNCATSHFYIRGLRHVTNVVFNGTAKAMATLHISLQTSATTCLNSMTLKTDSFTYSLGFPVKALNPEKHTPFCALRAPSRRLAFRQLVLAAAIEIVVLWCGGVEWSRQGRYCTYYEVCLIANVRPLRQLINVRL